MNANTNKEIMICKTNDKVTARVIQTVDCGFNPCYKVELYQDGWLVANKRYDYTKEAYAEAYDWASNH